MPWLHGTPPIGEGDPPSVPSKPLEASATLPKRRRGPIRLLHLNLRRFRNYERATLTLDEPRLVILGPNGAGKSNLLEAVELMGTMRSHRAGSDGELISHGQSGAIVQGRTDGGDELELRLRRHGGRQVRRNGRLLKRQSDLLGHLRCVSFSAVDLDLVRGEPSRRRTWVDDVVLQLEPTYSDLVQRYRRLLRQRRRVWHLSMQAQARSQLLDVLDEQMSIAGGRILRRRQRALDRLEPYVRRWHARLSGTLGALELRYQPGADSAVQKQSIPWESTLREQLIQQRSREARLGTPQIGPHRDEISFALSERSARRFGSAGQQRSLVLALKLAELELIEQICGAPPVLVLDDVLAELDPQRQCWLLEAAGNGHQCLISATHLTAFDPAWRQHSQLMRVEQGVLMRPLTVAEVR